MIDTECGAYGDNGCIDWVKTAIDFEIDNESLFSKSFSFEKLFSGNFIGDIARRIFLDLTKERLLFSGSVNPKLTEKNSFSAKNLVQIESSKTNEDVKKVIADTLGYSDLTSDDIAIIRYVCRIVSIRAAILVSCLLSVYINRMDKIKSVIAIDGSLYQYHPKIHDYLMDFIKVLAPNHEFQIILAEDGSGKGAGLAAAAIVNQI